MQGRAATAYSGQLDNAVWKVEFEQQAKWARAWSAPTLEYDDMSHVGPLLGASAHAVAHDVEAWLVGSADDGLERNRG